MLFLGIERKTKRRVNTISVFYFLSLRVVDKILHQTLKGREREIYVNVLFFNITQFFIWQKIIWYKKELLIINVDKSWEHSVGQDLALIWMSTRGNFFSYDIVVVRLDSFHTDSQRVTTHNTQGVKSHQKRLVGIKRHSLKADFFRIYIFFEKNCAWHLIQDLFMTASNVVINKFTICTCLSSVEILKHE